MKAIATTDLWRCIGLVFRISARWPRRRFQNTVTDEKFVVADKGVETGNLEPLARLMAPELIDELKEKFAKYYLEAQELRSWRCGGRPRLRSTSL